MGTELIARGLSPGGSPDMWNLKRPKEVRDVHASYAEAGAQVLTTNSFGSNAIRLKASGAHGLIDRLNRAAARLAREASGDCMVAGDIGPTGEILAPLGKLSLDETRAAFRAQARELAAAGVDLFIVETFFNLQEARCALEAVREVCSLPVWVSLTFRRTARGFFTVYGDRPLPALTMLLEGGADKAGANCTLASADMADLATELVPDLGAHAFFQPNAGEPQVDGSRLVYRETPAHFAREMARIAALEPGAVGGCCGTTPDHIRALAGALERRMK
ncbi:homocysteine S-methyltransferase family protein [Candidatus Fermentibacteria bacterium]|nr:homocysteine S-methyltransferase family protein [Candidatus Fermentibacteria bacterium]